MARAFQGGVGPSQRQDARGTAAACSGNPCPSAVTPGVWPQVLTLPRGTWCKSRGLGALLSHWCSGHPSFPLPSLGDAAGPFSMLHGSFHGDFDCSAVDQPCWPERLPRALPAGTLTQSYLNLPRESHFLRPR